MQTGELLREATEREITSAEALHLFQETRNWEQALRLFQAASKVRDQEVGRKVKVMGHLTSITRCTIEPPCRYCLRSASPASAWSQKYVLSRDELVIGAQAMEETGIRRVQMGGGALWGEEGVHATLKAVQAVVSASKLGVWITNMPSITPDDVPRFKEEGVKGIGCHLETMSEDIYRELRPGDSLQVRKRIIEATDKVGLGIDNVLMIGLGEEWDNGHPYQAWVDFLFYFKQFRNLKILSAHPFHPFPGTSVATLPAGSPFEAAKAKAIARLVFRNIDIAGADEVAGLMAGANLIMHAVSVTRAGRTLMGLACGSPSSRQIADNLVLRNYLPAISRHLKELQMELQLGEI